MKVELELIHKIGRNVGLRESCHVAKFLGSVVRHETLHLDVLGVDAETVCKTLRQESKDLADSGRASSDESIVQAIVETNLDERAVRRSFRNTARRLNHTGHGGREASRGSSA